MEVTEGLGLLQGSLVQHLAALPGVRGASALVAEAGDWRVAASFGEGLDQPEARAEQAMAAGEGGAVEPMAGGWAARYATRSAGLKLVVLLRLADLPPAELQARLVVIEARIGWLMVAALAERHAGAEGQGIAADLGAQMLLGAAQARTRAMLADQWIARLETAFAPVLTAVLWAGTAAPKLVAVSGGGSVENGSDQRSVLEDVARRAVAARVPLAAGVGGQGDIVDEPKLAELGARFALALPVDDGRRVAAVVVLCFDAPDVRLQRGGTAETVAALLSESLAVQGRAHPRLLLRLGNWLAAGLILLFGRTAWKLKVAVLILLLALGVAALVPTEVRPGFVARIEADDRQIVSAPFDGFLTKAPFQSGDSVAAGDVLVQFDDSDLRLQVTQSRSELAEIDTRLQTARAQRDSATVRQLESRRAQGEIAVDLLDRRIAQAEVTAPRPLIVVAGDAWRRVGDRVRQGEPLLELAAPGSFRVRAFVDEDWIAELRQAQSGSVLLAAYPERPFAVRLVSVGNDPVFQGGQNAFPVVLGFEAPPGVPVLDGMRGIARIDMGRQSVLQAYTRGLRRWAERALWRWR